MLATEALPRLPDMGLWTGIDLGKAAFAAEFARTAAGSRLMSPTVDSFAAEEPLRITRNG